MSRILLEICCGSIDDAIMASKGGADRVELCSALFLGGLTPSLGTVIEVTSRLRIPVIVMIRPRGGGFCYSDAEMAAMERDTVLALEHGADGIVFGILREDGTVDMGRTRRLRGLTGDRQAVFHRAFDVVPDPFQAVDELVDLGITRILTSGQQDSVPEGYGLIKKPIDYAGDRIEIMPGGGIKPQTVDQVVAATGCRQVHLTAFKTYSDPSTHNRPFVAFGGALYPPEDRFQMTDQELVRKIVQRLK